jgi:Cu-Zn family superoxide dismutase
MKKLLFMVLGILMISLPVQAEELVIRMNIIDSSGIGKAIGSITASSSPYGTIFTPDLVGLSPGLHGFHVHQNPSCGTGEKGGNIVPGLAAGGHFDPAGTNTHLGPYEKGHLGDLPALYVDGRPHDSCRGGQLQRSPQKVGGRWRKGCMRCDPLGKDP